MNKNIIQTNQQFIVIDNFLNNQTHKSIWQYLQTIKYKFAHNNKWTPAFHMADKPPLWGEPALSHAYSKNTQFPNYPTNTPMDEFFQEVLQLSNEITQLIGQHGKDWAYFFARPYIYPADAGLRWHTDGKYGAAGAFVYYAHPYWSPYWGGELLVANPTTSTEKITALGDFDEAKRSTFSSSQHDKIIMQPGLGQYILPIPNRLVLLKGGPYHTIKKVDSSAGDNIRVTIQGFFQDPAKQIDKKESKTHD